MIKIFHTEQKLIGYLLFRNVQNDPGKELKISLIGYITDSVLNIDIPDLPATGSIRISYDLQTHTLLSKHRQNFRLQYCNILLVANHQYVIICSCLECAEGQIRKSYMLVGNCYSLPSEVSVLAMTL